MTLTAAHNSHIAVLAISSAFPQHLHKQDKVLEAFIKRTPLSVEDQLFAKRVYPLTLIETGSSALSEDDLYRKMDRTEFANFCKKNLLALALEAAKKALSNWGGNILDITHIIWGTTTVVMDMPTPDAILIQRLGLSPFVKRVCVQHMGCLTGYRCMSLAYSIAKGDPNSRILVVAADLRSTLGNQLGEHFSRTSIIECAMFRDAGGCCIIGVPNTDDKPLVKILNHESVTIPDTGFLAHISEANDAEIILHIDRQLPDYVEKYSLSLINRLLQGTNVSINALSFAAHSGGPKILKLLQKGLGVEQSALESSWSYLKTHGNCSGGGNIPILDLELNKTNVSTPYICCLSMGPGFTMDCMLLERY